MQHISTNPSSARFCQHTAACQRCCSTCCFRSATRAALSIVSANFANVASRLSPRGLGRGACSVLPSPMRSTWELNGEACSRWCHRLLAKIVYKYHWIGLREKTRKHPIIKANKKWFPVDFHLNQSNESRINNYEALGFMHRIINILIIRGHHCGSTLWKTRNLWGSLGVWGRRTKTMKANKTSNKHPQKRLVRRGMLDQIKTNKNVDLCIVISSGSG